jgi:exopolyphosphatase/guanosine-5'-triphosphate,3'-diphosphate pyrophosphatase
MMHTTVTADVLDIGSNSIRYLHAAVTPQGVTAVERKRLITTRLAQGLDASMELGEEPMRRSLDAIRAFVAISREKSTPFLFAYATSAVRDAKNGGAFCARVRAEAGIDVDVLPGCREARLAYIGAVGRAGGGLIDIGGGSAQIMTAEQAHSFPIGCVRVKEIGRAHV